MEVLTLQWSHIDFERGLIDLPESKTRRKTIVMSVTAIDLLRDRERHRAFVIPGADAGRPRSDLKKPGGRSNGTRGSRGCASTTYDTRSRQSAQAPASARRSSATDGREIVLSRYTELEPELRLLIDRMKLALPARPPPKIAAAALLAQTVL